jgi:hypothetical protein
MQNKPVIAVLTDFGPDSFYVGVIKAALCSAAPQVPVVDLSHSVPPHAIDQGSFILDTVCDFFPAGTVFLAVVDPGVGGKRRNLVVEAGGLLFVGPDNGLFTEVSLRRVPTFTFEIEDSRIEPYRMSPPAGRTFLGRDVFAPAAAALACGKLPREIGVETSPGPVTVPVPEVDIQPGLVRGVARYADPFGNILFAITGVHLRRAFGHGNPAALSARAAGQDLGTVRRCYADCPDGSPAVLVNSWDRVEIAVPGGNAMNHFAQEALAGISIEIRAKQ